MTLSLRESAGQFTRDFGLAGLSQTVSFDPAESYIPTTDFFDNRTLYLTTQADLSIQKTARLSFNFGGDGFLNRRHSAALAGSVGAVARSDVQYRVTRGTTVGAGYSYNHFTYTRVFGGTDVHSLTLSYSKQLSRRWEFSGYGGAMRVESKFIQVVPSDPIILELLGIPNTTQIFHAATWHPRLSGRLSWTFRNGIIQFSGARSMTPGNGLFLTSYTSNVMGGYTSTGLRTWSFTVRGGVISSSATGNIAGNYSNATGNLSVSRRLGRGVHLTGVYSVRQYSSKDFDKYNRLIYSATVGIGFTPGDVPLRIW
jgi:hypothetical protein